YSYGSAINSAGVVVGASAVVGDGSMHAIRYSGGVMTDLGALGGSNSYAGAINDRGQVVGFAQPAGNRGYRAYRTAPGGGLSTATLLGLGGEISYAFDIDNSGRVVGTSEI